MKNAECKMKKRFSALRESGFVSSFFTFHSSFQNRDFNRN